MNYRLLDMEEKISAFETLRKLSRLTHLTSGDVDAPGVCRMLSRLRVVGGFDDDNKLHYIYWTYYPSETFRMRYIAVAGLVNFNRMLLKEMRRVAGYLAEEWDLYGEIDADNPAGLKLAEACGFRIEAVLDSRTRVKYERRYSNG